MAIPPLPVARHLARHLPQDMRSQMRCLLHPWQNQKPRIVGDQMDVATSRPGVPADEPVTAAYMPRCARPCQTRDHLTAYLDQVFQPLAHWMLVTKIVVLFQQAVEQRLLLALPHLLVLPPQNLPPH